MKYIFTILLFLFSFAAFAQPQNSYTVPTIVSMKAYYGNSSRIYVVETGKDYYQCSPCTTDEITVFAGVGGRKWKQIEDTGKLSKSDTSSASPNALETQARAVNRAALKKNLIPVTQVITTGTTATVLGTTERLIYNPATLLSLHTLTLPVSPFDGQEVAISFGGDIDISGSIVITSLTIQPNTSQGIIGANVFSNLIVEDIITFCFSSTNLKWYRK